MATLPFHESVINDGELTSRNFNRRNFVGFISPQGAIINYNNPLGLGGHDNNPITDFFEEYFYMRKSDIASTNFFIRGYSETIKGLDWEKIYFTRIYNLLTDALKNQKNKPSDSYEQLINDLLLDWFKDVLVQYLGYHAVERLPRTITTSSPLIYKTFYNYLLNGFTIFQIPEWKYDKSLRSYFEHKQNDFFLPDSELRLKDEILSLKKRIPKEELYKYYR